MPPVGHGNGTGDLASGIETTVGAQEASWLQDALRGCTPLDTTES